VVGGVDALLSGDGAGFLKGTGRNLLNQVVGNAAGMAWKSVSKIIPHSSSPLLEGTMFGADPLKGATDLNTMATVENTAALRAWAMSPSGGGGSAGGFSSAAGTFARYAGSLGSGEGDGPEGSGLPTDGSPGDYGGEYTGGNFSWARAAGIGGAALSGGIGLYSGIRQGGGRGAATATASGLAAAGSIMALASKSLSVAGPIGMIAGSVLGLAIPYLFGDPKKNRADEIANTLKTSQYRSPDSINSSMTTAGVYTDYDRFGGVRGGTPIVQVIVNTMNSRSFQENSHEIASAVQRALALGHTGLQSEIRSL